MTVRIASVTFDGRDALVAGRFWSAAIGRPRDGPALRSALRRTGRAVVMRPVGAYPSGHSVTISNNFSNKKATYQLSPRNQAGSLI